ncbi:DUF3833 family protein [Asticcacaulis sp. YBE204]|uniref:DUF3833 family protein n=1 Tax=Asticcacaulis sp. YBE204 TaxID=1282363 RepID=UPI0003C3CE1F|nr:DUF3833 family protein [Asticcacaulis sp. YBE204]ESQ80542.1 hypothetical protein AEYBE204_04545 [Asticcacaulis sp. YBE204]
MRALMLATTLLTAPLLALGLSSCTTLTMANNSLPEPKMVIEDYFAGETYAYGVFEDRGRKLSRTFTVYMRGTTTADGFRLDERFLWNDGEKQSRTWTFKRTGTGTYEGTAGDVKGVATVTQSGNAERLTYLLNLPYKGKPITVRFDDWTHLISDGVAINRADVSKFGLHVGRVTVTFVKPGQAHPTAESLKP